MFPTKYRHGLPSTEYYVEEIPLLSIGYLTQLDLESLFMETKLYQIFKYFVFDPYIKWECLGGNKYIAIPLISVNYLGYHLKYFHNPTYMEVEFDFFLNHGINTRLERSDRKLIDTDKLEGSYIIDLSDTRSIQQKDLDYFKN